MSQRTPLFFSILSSYLKDNTMRRLFKYVAPLIMLLVILAACGNGGTSSNNSGNSSTTSRNLKFYVVTHGQASDPFWSVVKKGVDQGAHDMCVTAIYEAPASATFDVVAMSHLIDTAVAAH